MTPLRALVRNTGYLVFGEVMKPALSFVLILAVARMLGAEGIGAYTIILTVTGLIEVVVTAGISPVVVRGIAANRSQLSTWVSSGIGAALLVSLILVPVILLVLAGLDYPLEVERGIKILMFTLVVAIVQSQVLALCEGLQMMRCRTVVAVSDAAARVIIGALMIAGGYGVLGVVSAILIARTTTTAGALFLLKRRVGLVVDPRTAFVNSLVMVRSAMPFVMIALLSTGFWSVNTLLLSAFRPIHDVGVYTAALRLPDMLRTIFYSYMIALLPVMSQAFVTSTDALKRQCDASIKYLALIAVPISL